MRSLLITLAVGAAALLLSGCPDMPGGPIPGSQPDSPWKAAGAAHVWHEGVAPTPLEGSAHAAVPAHHAVSEIAWFQGTIDEAFSHRGCSESRPRRTLFRF